VHQKEKKKGRKVGGRRCQKILSFLVIEKKAGEGHDLSDKILEAKPLSRERRIWNGIKKREISA